MRSRKGTCFAFACVLVGHSFNQQQFLSFSGCGRMFMAQKCNTSNFSSDLQAPHGVLDQASHDASLLTERTEALTLKTELTEPCAREAAPWTLVQGSRPRRPSSRAAASPTPDETPCRVRWSDQVDDNSVGPTPLSSVSNAFISSLKDVATATVHTRNGSAQASCYIGGSSGIFNSPPDVKPKIENLFSPKYYTQTEIAGNGLNSPTWPRIPLHSFPEFTGGSFESYFIKLKLILETYPEGERLPLLVSKLSENIITSLRGLIKPCLETMNLQEFVLCLSDQFREQSAKVDCRKSTDSHWPMQDVPMFNGDSNEDFDVWYRRAQMYLETYAPADRVHRLCSRLGSRPFEFVQQRASSIKRNYDELLCCLRREYSVTLTENEAQELFYTQRQSANMTLQSFEGELRKLARVAFPEMTEELLERTILKRFSAGINEVELVRHLAFHPPMNFPELYQAAEVIHRNRVLSSQGRNDRPQSVVPDRLAPTASPPLRPQRVNSPTTASRYPLSPNRVGRAGVMSPNPYNQHFQGRCLHCNQSGHFRRNCPQLSLNR